MNWNLKEKTCWCWLSLILMGCGEAYRERIMAGPFRGEAYEREVKSKPASSILIGEGGVLEAFYEAGENNPIVRMRTVSGTTKWMRVLVPKRKNEPTAFILSFRFQEAKSAAEGYKVTFSCNWSAGGEESGLIRLNSRMDFESFSISW